MSQVTIGNKKFTGWKANVIGGWHVMFVAFGFGLGYAYGILH